MMRLRPPLCDEPGATALREGLQDHALRVMQLYDLSSITPFETDCLHESLQRIYGMVANLQGVERSQRTRSGAPSSTAIPSATDIETLQSARAMLAWFDRCRDGAACQSSTSQSETA